jgi:soluble lytic murein transglycosylase-like protein
VLVAALAALLAGDPGERIAGGIAVVEEDPFAFEQDRAGEFLARGGRGLAHVLYALSPGGVEATAERTLEFEREIRAAASREGVRASTLEALVFLESAGRPDVLAGPDPASASGLAQILPQTATDLLGMSVDLRRSKRLTVRIARQQRRAARPDETGELTKALRRTRMLLRQRRRVDDRFDPTAALAGAARYLALAEDHFGREDLAATSYHMGIGNLDRVIATYLSPQPVSGSTQATVADHGLSYAQLYFDSSPTRNPRTYALLRELGDDSRHYLFKLEAAREIIRLYRDDRPELRRLDRLHGNKASAEEVLRPAGETEEFEDPGALRDGYDGGELVHVRGSPAGLGYRIAPELGELAPQLDESPALYRGLRPEALAALVYIARQVRATTGRKTVLTLTSAVRDASYQELLRGFNPEATEGYSLHTTGFAFDLARDRGEGALVAALERLRALDVLDWVYEAGAIHVTVGPDAESLLADPGLL